PPPPSSVNPATPAEFDRIVSKALEKNVDLRYQTAADLRADLKRLRSGDTARTAAARSGSLHQAERSASHLGERSVPWKPVAAAAAVILATMAGIFFYTSRPRAFSERDSVVIADFANTTNEPVFDDSLMEAHHRQLRQAPGQLRRKLGESLASMEKYDAPIQGATTASLDGLKSYSLALSTRRRQGDSASLPLLRKALEQDPDFALAHARLSTVYGNLGEASRSREEITRAYAARDRVSEPERLYITARYAQTVEGSTQKSIEAYVVWTQTYPNDFVPHSNLA